MNRRAALAALFSLAIPISAHASVRLEITGYVAPAYQVTYKPQAVPRDRWVADMNPSIAGIIMTGTPVEKLHYALNLVAGAGNFTAVNGINVAKAGGAITDITATTFNVYGIAVEESTLGYRPGGGFDVKAGYIRIPFSVEGQAPNTALVFGNRAGTNDVFAGGVDLGTLATFEPKNGLARISAGVFNGSVFAADPANERGIAYEARADLNFGGALPFTESDFERGGPRISGGIGFIYHPAILYDTSGFNGHKTDDIRLCLSGRAAVAGFYAQAEYFFRQQTDVVNLRPDTSTGAYGQASFYSSLGLEPVGRYGYTVVQQSTNPVKSTYVEGGLNWYPQVKDDGTPGNLRLSALYHLENDVTQGEKANLFVLAGQLTW